MTTSAALLVSALVCFGLTAAVPPRRANLKEPGLFLWMLSMLLRTTTPLLLFAMVALAESGPTITQELPITAWSAPDTCTLGALLQPLVNAPSPICTVLAGKGGSPVRVPVLEFPDGARTCVAVVLEQPNELDAASIHLSQPLEDCPTCPQARPLAVRIPYTRIGGGIGTASGSFCIGECAILTARVASQPDGSIVGSPAYGPVLWQSDPMPNGTAPGIKRTAIIRGLVWPVARNNPAIIEVCRDARSTFVWDTSTATIRLLNPLSIVWPTIQSVP